MSRKLSTCYQPGRSKTLFFDLNPKGAKSVYPGFPDAAGAAGRTLKSRSRPLPTHPGMKYFREETLAVDELAYPTKPQVSRHKADCLDTNYSAKWKHPYYVTLYPWWPRHGTDTPTRRFMTRHDTELFDTKSIDTA